MKIDAESNKPAAQWNPKANALTKIRKIKGVNFLNSKWHLFGAWLHQKLGHTGKEILYFPV